MSLPAKLWLAWFVFAIIALVGTCPGFRHTNHLVQLSDNTYAVRRCSSLFQVWCYNVQITQDRESAFSAWLIYEAMDHPPKVTKVLL